MQKQKNRAFKHINEKRKHFNIIEKQTKQCFIKYSPVQSQASLINLQYHD